MFKEFSLDLEATIWGGVNKIPSRTRNQLKNSAEQEYPDVPPVIGMPVRAKCAVCAESEPDFLIKLHDGQSICAFCQETL